MIYKGEYFETRDEELARMVADIDRKYPIFKRM